MESSKEQGLTFEIPNMEGQSNEEDECYNSVEEYFLDCCRYGSLDEVKETLQDEVDINWFDNNLNTPLHMASANGHIDVIKELLNVKKEDKLVLNLNARNADGCTALHWAVINNQKPVIELLCTHGADCNIKNKMEKTPLEEACEAEYYEIAIPRKFWLSIPSLMKKNQKNLKEKKERLKKVMKRMRKMKKKLKMIVEIFHINFSSLSNFNSFILSVVLSINISNHFLCGLKKESKIGIIQQIMKNPTILRFILLIIYLSDILIISAGAQNSVLETQVSYFGRFQQFQSQFMQDEVESFTEKQKPTLTKEINKIYKNSDISQGFLKEQDQKDDDLEVFETFKCYLANKPREATEKDLTNCLTSIASMKQHHGQIILLEIVMDENQNMNLDDLIGKFQASFNHIEFYIRQGSRTSSNNTKIIMFANSIHDFQSRYIQNISLIISLFNFRNINEKIQAAPIINFSMPEVLVAGMDSFIEFFFITGLLGLIGFGVYKLWKKKKSRSSTDPNEKRNFLGNKKMVPLNDEGPMSKDHTELSSMGIKGNKKIIDPKPISPTNKFKLDFKLPNLKLEDNQNVSNDQDIFTNIDNSPKSLDGGGSSENSHRETPKHPIDFKIEFSMIEGDSKIKTARTEAEEKEEHDN